VDYRSFSCVHTVYSSYLRGLTEGRLECEVQLLGGIKWADKAI